MHSSSDNNSEVKQVNNTIPESCEYPRNSVGDMEVFIDLSDDFSNEGEISVRKRIKEIIIEKNKAKLKYDQYTKALDSYLKVLQKSIDVDCVVQLTKPIPYVEECSRVICDGHENGVTAKWIANVILTKYPQLNTRYENPKKHVHIKVSNALQRLHSRNALTRTKSAITREYIYALNKRLDKFKSCDHYWFEAENMK